MAAKDSYHAIAAAITDGHEVVASQMFGMPVLKVRGKAFAGLHGEVMTFKLPSEKLQSAMKLPGGGPFEPMPGRAMGGWVQVSTASEKDWKPLATEALAFVSSITPGGKPAARAAAKPAPRAAAKPAAATKAAAKPAVTASRAAKPAARAAKPAKPAAKAAKPATSSGRKAPKK